MRCLLPIAPASAEELLLFSRPEALAAWTLPVARTVRAIPGARLLVCTPLPEAAELLRPLADEIVHAPLPGGAATLPRGEHIRLALEASLARGVLSPVEPVLVADFRNLRLGADTLRRAWEALAAGGTFASFAPLRDHPVQYRAPYRMLGIELLALPDAADARRTRPFFFDWRGLGLWDAGAEPFLPRALRLDAADSAGDLPLWGGGEPGPDAVVFEPETPVSARRLLPAGAGPAAAPAHAAAPALPLRLTPRGDGGLDWELGPDCAGSGLLLLWPLETVDGAPGRCLELAFGPLCGGGAARSGRLPASSARGADAWLACLLADAGPGAYDFFLPLDGGGLWRVDPATGRARHAQTGRYFNNRQEFPALHEPDLALCGGAALALAAALAAPGEGSGPAAWGVLELAPGEARKVRDRLDLALETGLRLRGLPAATPEAPCGRHAGPEDAPACLDLPEHRPGAERDATGLARARAALAGLNWRQRQLQWLAERHPRIVRADPVLGWALFSRAGELAVTAQRRLCEDEIAALVRTGARSAQRSPLVRPVAGAMPPGHPTGLAVGGRGAAYLCLRGDDGRGRLFAKDLDGGKPAPFGRPGADYLSLCRVGGLVHALYLRKDGAPAAGIDSFDISGAGPALAASHRLPEALQGRPRLVKLAGEGDALFALDFECRFLFELALPEAPGSELALRDVHGLLGSDLVQAYAARGGRLYAASFYDSVLAVKDLAGGGLLRVQNTATLMAALVDRDEVSGRTLLVSRADFPADYAPTPHWLHLLGDDGAPRSSLGLGRVFASALAVLEETGEALVLCRDGLLLRCPGGR